MKRSLASVLLTALLLSALLLSAAAASAEGPRWDLTDGTLSVFDKSVFDKIPWEGQKGVVKKVFIAGGIDAIGDHAFQDCTKLTKVIAPDSIETIGKEAFSGCESLNTMTSSYTKVSSVTVKAPGETVFANGAPVSLSASVAPSDADCKVLIWSCSNDAIATVSESGDVTGRSHGEVTVTCKAADGSGAKGSLKFTVHEYGTKHIDKKPATCTKPGYEAGKVIVCPECDKQCSRTKVISALGHKWDNGVVTVKPTLSKQGVKTYKCTRSDCGETRTEAIPKLTAVTGVTLDTVSKKLTVTGKVKPLFLLKATVKPSGASVKALKWTSSNTAAAKVRAVENNPGLAIVSSVGAGSAKITATSTDGTKIKAVCTVTVKKGSGSAKPVSSLRLNKTRRTLYTGDDQNTYALKAALTPGKPTYSKVIWYSDDPAVAKVSQSGRVTALKKGTAVITCLAADGSGKKASCRITVKTPVPVTGITLNAKSKTLSKGETFQLTPAFTPENATNQTVRWTSSDKAVATVSGKGLVRAVGKGTAKITCAAQDGSGVSVVFKVTVK